jgi:phage N-6-adenine-methyltransferase
MNAIDAEEYTQSLGQIVAGAWRQIALAHRLGVPAALGYKKTDGLRRWVEERLGGYIKMTVNERREAVAELAAEGHSKREVAAIVGTDETTVRRDKDAANAAPQDDNANETNGSDDIAAANAAPLGAIQAVTAQKSSTRDLLSQSDQNDWRTPRKYLDAARAVMGGIDLDPASSLEANETVQAQELYTEADNGLDKPWKGRVWLNPPYGGEARLFVERMIKEYQVGNVTTAMLLVNSHPTETKWFQQLFDYTVCFIAGRIDFGGPSRAVASTSTHGSAIVYLGKEIDKFRQEFSKFGAVIKKI